MYTLLCGINEYSFIDWSNKSIVDYYFLSIQVSSIIHCVQLILPAFTFGQSQRCTASFIAFIFFAYCGRVKKIIFAKFSAIFVKICWYDQLHCNSRKSHWSNLLWDINIVNLFFFTTKVMRPSQVCVFAKEGFL